MKLADVLPEGSTVGILDPQDLGNGRTRNKVALADPLYQDALRWLIQHGAPADYSYYTLPSDTIASNPLDPNAGPITVPGPTVLVWHGFGSSGQDVFIVTDPTRVYFDAEEGPGTGSWAPSYTLSAILPLLGKPQLPLQWYPGLEIRVQQDVDPVGPPWPEHSSLMYHPSTAYFENPGRWPQGAIYPRVLPNGQTQRFEMQMVVKPGGSPFNGGTEPAWRNLSGIAG